MLDEPRGLIRYVTVFVPSFAIVIFIFVGAKLMSLLYTTPLNTTVGRHSVVPEIRFRTQPPVRTSIPSQCGNRPTHKTRKELSNSKLTTTLASPPIMTPSKVQSITSSLYFVHRRIVPELTQRDWDAAFTRLHSLHAAIRAHGAGYGAIVRALERNPAVVPVDTFRCGFQAARAGKDVTLAVACAMRSRLRDVETGLKIELRTLEEYEREYRAGLVLGRMRMSDGELGHVVVYTKSWGVVGSGMGEEADGVLREAGSWLVFEEAEEEEWEFVGLVGKRRKRR